MALLRKSALGGRGKKQFLGFGEEVDKSTGPPQKKIGF